MGEGEEKGERINYRINNRINNRINYRIISQYLSGILKYIYSAFLLTLARRKKLEIFCGERRNREALSIISVLEDNKHGSHLGSEGEEREKKRGA